jgi:hypothetical protein
LNREVSRFSDHAKKLRRRMVTLPPADHETIGLIAVKKGITRHEILRLAREAGGNEIIVPVEVEPKGDGSVMLSLLGALENFAYDPDAGRWVGTEGSLFNGGPDVFDDTTAWSVAITLDEIGPPLVQICHNGECEELKIDASS